MALPLGFIHNDKPVLCISARDIELEDEVWTCGVDRFSQHVRKFESEALLLLLPPLLQTSALWRGFLLASRQKQSVLIPALIRCFKLSPSELQSLGRAD